MRIYQFDDGRTLRSFPTLREAMVEANAALRSDFYLMDDIEIEAVTVPPVTRQTLCDILNGDGGYSTHAEKVKTLRLR